MKTRLLELLAKIFCSGYLSTFYVFSDEISAAIFLVKNSWKINELRWYAVFNYVIVSYHSSLENSWNINTEFVRYVISNPVVVS